ncbi:Pentatricopeptide repeat-containing protein, chloroplastic/mitochondrial [Glycine max]|nr:Pentatricopeptide repeat-containing protein, chloroplastic/mitochondrial [Glycine max]
MPDTMAASPPPLLFYTTTSTNNQSQQHFIHTHLIHLLNEPTTISMLHLKKIHAQMFCTVNTNLPKALFLYTKILQRYSFLQANLTYATRVFRHFPNPNSYMWNTLIRAHARSTNTKHKHHKAMELYKVMMNVEEKTAVPDNHTFHFVLKACAYTFSLCEGKQVHAHVLKHGFVSNTHVVTVWFIFMRHGDA